MNTYIVKSLKQARRLIIAVIGLTVLMIGIAMIVLPGPAFVVIPAGLAILATEFIWAKSLLTKVKDRLFKLRKEVFMKPSEREEEYFARMEFEKKKKIEEEKHKKLAEQAKKSLRELHFMRCPKCGMELIEIDYKGIEVDKCSECDGIWLDAGELESVSKLEKSGIDKLFSVFKK